MKILIIGCWSELGTNTSIFKALKNLGHDVRFINYINFGTWTLIRPIDQLEKLIEETARVYVPDLIFICKGEHLRPSYLRDLSTARKTVCWFMDPQIEFNRMGGFEISKACPDPAPFFWR